MANRHENLDLEWQFNLLTILLMVDSEFLPDCHRVCFGYERTTKLLCEALVLSIFSRDTLKLRDEGERKVLLQDY